MKLTNRFASLGHYLAVELLDHGRVGPADIGYTPIAKYPAPGTKGSVTFGLETYEPIEGVVAKTRRAGCQDRGDISVRGGNSVGAEDPMAIPFTCRFTGDGAGNGSRVRKAPRRRLSMLSGGTQRFVSNMELRSASQPGTGVQADAPLR